MRIQASKKSRFEHVLTLVHPAIARLAKNIASRETPRTSMMDLAVRVATILQKAADDTGSSPEELVARVRNKIVQVADWAVATGNEWKSLRTLDEMALAAQEWHAELARRADDKAQYRAEDTVVMEFPDGWKIVEMHPDNCEAEGKIMGHCVAGYADYIRKGLDRIFSLRDPSNRPHVTFNTTQRDTSDEAETWDEDYQWEESMERAERQRNRDWEKLVGPDAVRGIRLDVSEELSANYPSSLFDDEMLNQKAAEMAEERILANKAKYEKKWGPTQEVDKYSGMPADDDKYGDEDHMRAWATKDYERRQAEFEEPQADWHVEQIQGKEDSAPLDKYRQYLHQFLTELDHDTGNVEERMLPVNSMMEQLEEVPAMFQTYAEGLRDVDQDRLYDYMVGKQLTADPDDDRYSNDWKLAEYVKRKIQMGSATPEHEAFVKKLFEIGETRVIVGTGIYEVIRGGRQWVINKLLQEEHPERFAWYIQLMTPKGIFKDPGLRMAAIRKLELIFQQTKAAGGEFDSRLVSNYVDLLGEDGAEKNIEKVLDMESYAADDEIRRRRGPYYSTGTLQKGTAAALAKIYQKDPERWKRLIRSLSPGARENILESRDKRNLVEPYTIDDEKSLELPFEENLFDLISFGDNPAWNMSGMEHARSNWAVRDVHEQERRRQVPQQMQLMASKLARLAQKLEEVSPRMADRLEVLL